MKMTKLKITAGAVVVNSALVYHRSKNIVAIVVDMATKHVQVDSECNGPAPTFWLAATEHSLHLSEVADRDSPTGVAFPEFGGWDFWAIEASRYSVHVCLVRRMP